MLYVCTHVHTHANTYSTCILHTRIWQVPVSNLLTDQLSGLEIFSDFLNPVGKHWYSNVSYLIKYRPLSALAKQSLRLFLGQFLFVKKDADARINAHSQISDRIRTNSFHILPISLLTNHHTI